MMRPPAHESSTPSVARTRARLAVASAVVCALAVIGAVRLGWLESAELRAFDAVGRGARSAVPNDSSVRLVLITEDDIHRYGFPLPAPILDALVDSLRVHGARVVALDLFRDRIPSSGALRAGLESGLVIAAHKLGDASHRGVSAPDSLPAGATVGFTDVTPDDDGVVRRFLWLADDSANTYESLAFAAARKVARARGDSVGATPSGLPRLGTFEFAPFRRDDGSYRSVDDAGYQYVMPWFRAPRHIESSTVSQALGGALRDADVRNRMVFVGADAPSLPDFVALPVDVGLSRPEGTPGVAIHAVGASELLALAAGKVSPLRVTSDFLDVFYVACAAALGALLAWWQRTLAPALFLLLIGCALMATTALLGMRANVWIPLVAPLAAFSASAALSASALGAHERRSRAVLGHLFARHLSPQLARAIWERRDELRDGNRLKPQRLFATILFADLRGFSSRAERMDPAQLLEWIGDVTDAMTRVVMAHGGIVDDFAGDGIKADFGVPLPRSGEAAQRESAEQGVRAALAMEAALANLNVEWSARGHSATAMRIGIASGEVVAGNVGASDRLKFTVVGDVVNVAARLEAFDGVPFDPAARICRILVDGTTAALVHGTLPVTSLGDFLLKGREHPVSVFAVSRSTMEVSHAST